MNTFAKLHIFIFVLSITLGGCIDFAKETPVKKLYSIQLENDKAQNTIRYPGVLKIRRFNIAAPFAGRNFVYYQGQGVYESDFYNEFLVSPDINISGVVTRWLAESKLFSRVVPTSSQLEPEYTLEGNITALYADYSKDDAYAVIEIQFLLLNADLEPVFDKNISIRKKISAKKPEALIIGYHAGLADLLAQLQTSLANVE